MWRSGTAHLANVRALPKEVCSFAKRLGLNYETAAAGSLYGEIQDTAEITMPLARLEYVWPRSDSKAEGE